MRVAVVQHQVRTHERMDLAALLAAAESAADEDARVLVCPCIPGLARTSELLDAFVANVSERAPGLVTVAPCTGVRSGPPYVPVLSPLGPTVVMGGDDFLDPDVLAAVAAARPDALVWQSVTSSELEAEAVMELAIAASLSVAPLVIVAGLTGEARGVSSRGGSSISHLGEVLAEAGAGAELLVADVPFPLVAGDADGPLPVPAPVLTQRLAARRR